MGRRLATHGVGPPARPKMQSQPSMCCSDFSGRGLVGELVKDNFVYASMTELRMLDLSDNNIGYGVAPIPNDLSKLQKVEYLCAPTTGRAWQPVGVFTAPFLPCTLISGALHRASSGHISHRQGCHVFAFSARASPPEQGTQKTGSLSEGV